MQVGRDEDQEIAETIIRYILLEIRGTGEANLLWVRIQRRII